MFGKLNNIQYEQTNRPKLLWYVCNDYTGYTVSNQNITFSNPVLEKKISGFYINNVGLHKK